MRRITREELSRCNGRNGAPFLIAYRGVVYDVSGCFLWKGGRHQALHEAGRDLTNELEAVREELEFVKRKYKLMWGKMVEQHAEKKR